MWLESPEYECYCWEVFWKQKQNISEFTQQDGTKKRTAKCLSVTKVKGLLLACLVRNSLNMNVFGSFTKRSVQRNVKFGGKFSQTKFAIIFLLLSCCISSLLSGQCRPQNHT